MPNNIITTVCRVGLYFGKINARVQGFEEYFPVITFLAFKIIPSLYFVTPWQYMLKLLLLTILSIYKCFFMYKKWEVIYKDPLLYKTKPTYPHITFNQLLKNIAVHLAMSKKYTRVPSKRYRDRIKNNRGLAYLPHYNIEYPAIETF